MQETNQPSPIAFCEIAYYFAFAILRRLFEKGRISLGQLRRGNVALAGNYGVLPYHI